LENHRLINDGELKNRAARRQPYRRWVEENKISVHGLFTEITPAEVHDDLIAMQKRFGYSREDVELIIKTMAASGKEPVGSMGNDAALAVLSDKPQLLFNYFKQLFAQVTNPPIDPIREELVMSLTTYIGNRGNILAETPAHARLIKLNRPVLTDDELLRLERAGQQDFQSRVLTMEFPAGGDGAVLARLESENRAAGNQFHYLSAHENWPVYENTSVRYFGDGAETLEAMKADLEKAEKFIFMEYFIVADNSAFQEIREILVRKARQGVEVRLMYDDIGSLGFVNLRFARGLSEDGIRCRVFNPAVPVVNLFLNHRDHRKTTVIDGKVGYIGGYNLSDEYFGRARPYGVWKDTGLRLEGEAVRSLTASFFELWNVTTKEDEDFARYLNICHKVTSEGFVQPFNDNPLSEERTAENVYLNLIAQAEKTLYITTPYLIITDEMSRALRLAAKRGVDVRIITPGIPDKKVVFAITRSYYSGLARQGVRIFEYTPGFCHAKQCLCDGKIASIGSSNFDYRSLYHHFENDVLLYGCDAIGDMARDFDVLFSQCSEVTQRYSTGSGAILRMWQCILRLFAPLV